MGGYGSGRWGWGPSKITVEDCLTFDLGTLSRDKVLAPGYCGIITWRDSATGEKTGSIGARVEAGIIDGLVLRLEYRTTIDGRKEDVEDAIPLESTRPYFGGVRWWFRCMGVGRGTCWRRVAKLHLPPGGIYFRCRHCYDLTYESCRRSRSFGSLFKLFRR